MNYNCVGKTIKVKKAEDIQFNYCKDNNICEKIFVIFEDNDPYYVGARLKYPKENFEFFKIFSLHREEFVFLNDEEIRCRKK
jgi:hypothetical protein